MGRRASYHWDKREQAYRTDAGGKSRYFRGIRREDRAAIATAFAEFLAEMAAKAKPPEPTVEDVCAAFIGATRGVRPRTVKTHKSRLVLWSEWNPGDGLGMLGGRKAASLEAKALRAPLRAWAEAGMSGHYRAGIARSVKATFAWAATEEGGRLIPANPFAEVKVPTVDRSPERYAERREVAAFLRFCWRRAKASPGVFERFGKLLTLMVRVAAQTGARPGELCSAWWDDLDEERGTITLPPDRHKTGGKTNRNRVIYLTQPLVRALVREKTSPDRHPISIFVHKRGFGGRARGAGLRSGEPWGRYVTLPGGKKSFTSNSSPLSRTIRWIRDEAIREAARLKELGQPTRGLELLKSEGANKFVMYQLRHTTASDHLMAGGNPSTVAELLGTSTRQLETTYSHLLDHHLSRAADDLATKRRRRSGE